MNHLSKLYRVKPTKYTPPLSGRVIGIKGMVIEADGPLLSLGTRCMVQCDKGGTLCEIIGFGKNKVFLMPFGTLDGIAPNYKVESLPTSNASITVHEGMLGTVLDGLGQPFGSFDFGVPAPYDSPERGEGNGEHPSTQPSSPSSPSSPTTSQHDPKVMPLYAGAPDPLTRSIITEPIYTGVKAIDGLLTMGSGQRVGIFAGSGVGKSVLLGMIARQTTADVNVIALVGERGREVKEFIEHDLGVEGLKRSVIIVSTSDTSPLLRRSAPFVATAVAEYFASKGNRVMLMMDSLTRFAMAQREIGLSAGEPPTSKGYPPSAFSYFPRLLERAGTTSGKGSITAIYTVLVESDDMNDPVADSVRSIIDGHIVLDRALAAKNHFPSIRIMSSASRVMKSVINTQHDTLAGKIKQLYSDYLGAEDLINIGAYASGSNRNIDEARSKIDSINAFLKQDLHETFTIENTLEQMSRIVGAVPPTGGSIQAQQIAQAQQAQQAQQARQAQQAQNK